MIWILLTSSRLVRLAQRLSGHQVFALGAPPFELSFESNLPKGEAE